MGSEAARGPAQRGVVEHGGLSAAFVDSLVSAQRAGPAACQDLVNEARGHRGRAAAALAGASERAGRREAGRVQKASSPGGKAVCTAAGLRLMPWQAGNSVPGIRALAALGGCPSRSRAMLPLLKRQSRCWVPVRSRRCLCPRPCSGCAGFSFGCCSPALDVALLSWDPSN